MSDPSGRSNDASRSGVERPDDETKQQLFAEGLSVTKDKVETERVRVSARTVEREAAVGEDLARERVEIETIPTNLRIDAVPEVRQEGDTTIIPVVEEQLGVERRLIHSLSDRSARGPSRRMDRHTPQTRPAPGF